MDGLRKPYGRTPRTMAPTKTKAAEIIRRFRDREMSIVFPSRFMPNTLTHRSDR